MSRFTALFLAGIICCQAFYNVGVLSYWVANRSYIAANLCENRAKPKMHCEGKCYLKKNLAGATNPSSSDASLPTLKKGLDLAECPALVAVFLYGPVVLETIPVLWRENCQYAAGFPNAVFHPPSLFV